MPGMQLNLTNLKTLILTRATINDDQVLQLLSSTTNLRKFHLGMAYSLDHLAWNSLNGEKPFQNVPIIIQGLKSIKQTVQKWDES